MARVRSSGRIRPAAIRLANGRIASHTLLRVGGEERGRDNAKNVNGRKRHIVVDSLGLLLAVLVTAEDVDDAHAAAELFERLEDQPMESFQRMYADRKYHHFALDNTVGVRDEVRLEERSDEGAADGKVTGAHG